MRPSSIIWAFIFILGGCCLIPEYQPLMNLKNLADNRSRTERYIEKEEGLYHKLEQDIKKNRLKEGASRKELLRRYGPPVFSRPVDNKTRVKEILIYRHPTEYFSSDMIYLDLDDKEKLCSWQIKPAPLAEEKKQTEKETTAPENEK